MALQKIRSYYDDVVEPLERLARRNLNFDLQFMGFIDHDRIVYRQLFLSIAGREAGKAKDVLISGGVHGEEPAGVYTLMRFLEDDIHSFLGDYRFLIFPCVNPFGFEHGYRFNPQPDPDHEGRGMDVNRHFKPNTDCQEAVKVMRVLSRLARSFVCTTDLHETDPNWASEGFTASDNPHTFYMWETAFEKSIRIGNKVIEEVGRIAPLCDWDKIYKDTNQGGVIWYPEGCSNPVYALGTTLDGFLSANYTPQSFTLETPCGWDMERRVDVHLTALKTILELKRNA